MSAFMINPAWVAEGIHCKSLDVYAVAEEKPKTLQPYIGSSSKKFGEMG